MIDRIFIRIFGESSHRWVLDNRKTLVVFNLLLISGVLAVYGSVGMAIGVGWLPHP